MQNDSLQRGNLYDICDQDITKMSYVRIRIH